MSLEEAAGLTAKILKSRVRDSVSHSTFAEVAELVDALVSGISGVTPVEVRVLFSAPLQDVL